MVDVRDILRPGPRSGRIGAGPTEPAQVADSRAKRALDLTLACLLLVFLSPILILAAATIAVESPGPILFRQERTGLDGRVIRIFKFRTLHVVEDGDTVVAVTPNDPRLTPFGAVLRRTSVDELPQLLNVICGEMSLVGPRPHALVHDRLFSTLAPEYGRRFRARPGLTGLAQVTGSRGAISSRDQLAARLTADNTYIDQWSLTLDLKILFRTARTLLIAPDGA